MIRQYMMKYLQWWLSPILGIVIWKILSLNIGMVELSANMILHPLIFYPITQNGETGSGETAANEETSAASGTVDSAENQETAVETAGAAQDLMFSEATIMELPVTGTVLIPYNMENTVYFPTLDLYQCNPGVVFSAAEGTPVLAAADGEVVSVENDARTGLTVTMNLGNGYEAIYGQLTDVSLEAGQKVQKAARIGAVAAPTKYYVKEGSNLFFEMKKDGKAIDPMVYLPAISE